MATQRRAYALPHKAGGASRRIDIERVSTIAYVLLAGLAYVFLMWKTRGNTFFYDEWRWLFTRRTGIHSIVSSYNSQMMLLPSAAYQILWGSVGLRHYWVWRAIGIAIHVGLVSSVFVYAGRTVSASVALLVCLPLLFLGYGFEDVLWPINAGFVATLALGIWAMMILDSGRPGCGVIACGVLVLALACSELALVFALAVGVELTWRERSLRRCWIWLTPIILYLIWWLVYYEPSGMGSGLTGMPSFAASMAAAAIAGLLGLDPSWGQSLIVAAVILAILGFSRRGAFSPRAAAMLVLACSYWLLVAYGRNANPNAARYVYVGSIFLVLIGLEAVRGRPMASAALILGALVALFALAGNLHHLSAGEGEFRVGSQTSRAELGALDLMRGSVSPSLLIDQHYMPGLTAGQYFAAINALGSTPADTSAQILQEPEVTRQAADGLMLRGGAIQIRESSRQVTGSDTRTPVLESSTGGGLRKAGRCLMFTPAASPHILDLQLYGTLELMHQSGSPVRMLVRRFARSFGAVELPSLADHTTTLISARADADPLPWSVRLLPSRPVIACRLP